MSLRPGLGNNVKVHAISIFLTAFLAACTTKEYSTIETCASIMVLSLPDDEPVAHEKSYVEPIEDALLITVGDELVSEITRTSFAMTLSSTNSNSSDELKEKLLSAVNSLDYLPEQVEIAVPEDHCLDLKSRIVEQNS